MWFHIVAIGSFLAGFYVADAIGTREPLPMLVAVVLGFLAMCAVYLFKDQLDREELNRFKDQLHREELDRALSEESRKRQHGEATPAEIVRKKLNEE